MKTHNKKTSNMRLIIFALLATFIFPCATFASRESEREKIAFYFAGSEPKAGVHAPLSDLITEAIVNGRRYTAVDRTADALGFLAREHTYQRSGAVDDNQMAELGRQLGVDYVVAIRIVRSLDPNMFYVEARMIGVEYACIAQMAALTSDLNGIAELKNAAARIVRQLEVGASGRRNVARRRCPPRMAIAPTAEMHISRGDSFLESEDYDNAIVEYTEALRIERRNVEAMSGRGLAHHYKKDYDAAIRDYTAALRIEPRNVDVLGFRALTYAVKEDFDRAFADLNAALEVESQNADILYVRGIVYTMRGILHTAREDYNRAIADLNSVLRIDPNHDDAKEKLAEVQQLLRQLEPPPPSAPEPIETKRLVVTTPAPAPAPPVAPAPPAPAPPAPATITQQMPPPEPPSSSLTENLIINEWPTFVEEEVDPQLAALLSRNSGSQSRSGRAVVMAGGRSAVSIQPVIDRFAGLLELQYSNRLRNNRNLEGVITVGFAIDELGDVTSAQMINSTVRDSELERITIDSMRNLNFERIDIPGDITEVRCNFTFTP